MLYINPSDLNIPLGIITSFTIFAEKKKNYGKWYFEGAHPKHAGNQYYIFGYIIHQKLYVCDVLQCYIICMCVHSV